MYSVILCGGSGTRLWPLSRQNFPKQFLNLYSDKSLLQETFLRLSLVGEREKIYFVANEAHYYNVANQIKDVYPQFNLKNIIIEPASRNTAPAMTLAVKYLAEKVKINTRESIIFAPSDHYIGDNQGYSNVLKTAAEKTGEFIGTIGITPTSAETGYGYIQKGERLEDAFRVVEFKEKPGMEAAREYLASGNYVWNSGIYIFNIKTFVQELKTNSSDLYRGLTLSFDDFLNSFSDLPNISFDYAVSEKSERVITFEGDFGWSDIGSFDGLAKILESKQDFCKHVSVDSKNIFIHSTANRLVATVGVDDLIIIDNVDSILVQKKGRSEEVKNIVAKLKERKILELDHNLVVDRPWGRYEVLIESKNHKVKKIIVYPGAKLSLQKHYHRAEHWIVVKGIAKIINGNEEQYLKENESAFIPAFTRHRLENPGKINLEIIEVQTGDYVGEDDILREDDAYNRV